MSETHENTAPPEIDDEAETQRIDRSSIKVEIEPKADSDKVERKKSKRDRKSGQRFERRFFAQSAMNPWVFRILGGLGAITLGAGAYAYTYGHAFEADEKLKPIPSYLIAAGALLTGAAIFLGTSSEPPIRVGDPGISVERGELRRMPWWAIERITFESGSLALAIVGKDESGSSWSLRVPLKAHPEAFAWIVKEALDRIPKVVDIGDDVVASFPKAHAHAGTRIELEPLQVVGKKDAKTSRVISYEPDARVCTRCERVYMKSTVPKKCKCGASLAHLRGADAGDDDDIKNSENA